MQQFMAVWLPSGHVLFIKLYLRVYAACRLNIFSPRLAGCLQQPSTLFFLAFSVLNSCESDALPPIKRIEIINKSTGIKGWLQDHIASSVCLSLSQLQQLLLSSYLDFPAVPPSQLVSVLQVSPFLLCSRQPVLFLASIAVINMIYLLQWS